MSFKAQIRVAIIIIALMMINVILKQYRIRTAPEKDEKANFLNKRYDWFLNIDTKKEYGSDGMRPTQYFKMTKEQFVLSLSWLMIALITRYKAVRLIFIVLSIVGFFKIPDFWITYNTGEAFIILTYLLIILIPVSMAIHKNNEIDNNRLDNN